MPDKNTYPHLSGAEAKQRIEQDRAAEERFDRRERARVHSTDAVRKHKQRSEKERRRVRAQIERDRQEREAELARQDGAIDLSENLMAPTPEQFRLAGKSGFEQVSEIGDGSARRGAIVYRRRECPVAWKMMLAGVIDRTGFDACCWYRGIYETTGLAGNIASIDYGREVFAAPNAKSMFTDWQVEQQDLYRRIRREIRSSHLRMLDAMVLNDIPVNRAARVARTGHRNPKGCFEKAVEELCDVRKKLEGKI